MQVLSIHLRNYKIRVPAGCVFWIVLILLPFRLQAQIAEGKDKFLGNIIPSWTSIPADFDIYWNQVTPENAGKWAYTEPSRDNMDWTYLIQAYYYAKDMGFPFKQHNFVWGQQQPSWITTLDSAAQADEVEEWIQLYGEYFPETDFIDVVNEPINAPPPYKQALGGDGTTGWDWVIWAFEKAREYCPDAQLILNEYNVLHNSANINKMIQIANLLKERNLIDAIGIQGHYFELRYYAPATLKSGLDKLAATGLPIYISEFEINEADDSVQVQGYQKYFPIFWEHPSVQGITLWGYIQGKMWQTDGYLIRTDGTERPAMEWLWEYVPNTMAVESPMAVGSKPERFHLRQNHPNPFNPWTEIAYKISEPGNIKMEIYNLSGQSVRTLIDELQPSGEHVIQWNALDDSGNRVPSGVYFYNLRIDGLGRSFAESKKMLLVK